MTDTTITSTFQITVETEQDGIVLRQTGTSEFSIGNGARGDMIFISDDEFPAVFKALQQCMHEINERNSL